MTQSTKPAVREGTPIEQSRYNELLWFGTNALGQPTDLGYSVEFRTALFELSPNTQRVEYELNPESLVRPIHHIFAYSDLPLALDQVETVLVANFGAVSEPQIDPRLVRVDRADSRIPARIDLGIPTTGDRQAIVILSGLPGTAIITLVGTIRDWISTKKEVSRARFRTISEPEDLDWTEVVLELRVEAETDQALQLWDEVARRVDEVKATLGQDERDAINKQFGVHLVWDEEEDAEAEG